MTSPPTIVLVHVMAASRPVDPGALGETPTAPAALIAAAGARA
jgi:hypothetical protein